MRKFNFENLAKNLPDSFAKSHDKNDIKKSSNNYKLLEVERDSLNLLLDDAWAVHNMLDIDKATGKTLDKYGEMFDQPRGEANDVQYRLLIKSKIAQFMVTGDYPSIINVLRTIFVCPSEEILLEELPCSIKVTKLPVKVINQAGFTAKQVIDLISRILPTGISIKSYLFDGTFEFAHSYADMKVDGNIKGFTDSYENIKNPDAIGGYLGITMGDENEAILPI